MTVCTLSEQFLPLGLVAAVRELLEVPTDSHRQRVRLVHVVGVLDRGAHNKHSEG